MSADSFDDLGTDLVLGSAVYRDEDFSGCESFHPPASEIDHYEGRLEFWDGCTETAWKIPETPIQHERPSRQLTQMAARLAMVRGSRISSLGSSDLVHLDAAGRKRWLMQADELLYLHPDRVRLQGPAIDVDRDPLPDVVLEVDHTTDVRRRKLGIYKESGFPEIWVLVLWEASVRAPGLTIHVRYDEEYREETVSRVFPGWRGEEIHRALTEDQLSEPAWRALERTALAMGAREGTTSEDDPLMRSVLLTGYGEGYATSYRKAFRRSPAAGDCGMRARDAPRPGHRSVLAGPGGEAAPRRVPDRSADGGGGGLYRGGGLPAPHRGAARPALLTYRRPRGRVGAHPADPRAARPAHRRSSAEAVRRGRIQQSAGGLRPSVHRRASVARASKSDGVSHSSSAASTSSNTS